MSSAVNVISMSENEWLDAQDDIEELLGHLRDVHGFPIYGPLHDVACLFLQDILGIDGKSLLEMEDTWDEEEEREKSVSDNLGDGR